MYSHTSASLCVRVCVCVFLAIWPRPRVMVPGTWSHTALYKQWAVYLHRAKRAGDCGSSGASQQSHVSDTMQTTCLWSSTRMCEWVREREIPCLDRSPAWLPPRYLITAGVDSSMWRSCNNGPSDKSVYRRERWADNMWLNYKWWSDTGRRGLMSKSEYQVKLHIWYNILFDSSLCFSHLFILHKKQNFKAGLHQFSVFVTIRI